MTANVDAMLTAIVKKEGGFTDSPVDNAHKKRVANGDRWDSFCTNRGITQFTLSQTLNRQATIEEVRNLTEKDAKNIYSNSYYRGPRIDQLNPDLQPIVFDMSVNHGPPSAIMALQRVLVSLGYQCAVDGKIGPQTWRLSNLAISEKSIKTVVNAMVAERLRMFQVIIDKDPTQRKWANGWRNRANSFLIP